MLQQLNDGGTTDERKTRLALMRTHIKKTIELTPRFTQAYSMLGYIALVSKDELAETETALKKAIEYTPGRLDLRLTLAQVMLTNNEILPAQGVLTSLKSSRDDLIRYEAERLLDDITNRQQIEKDLATYRERRQDAEEAEARKPVEERPRDGPPIIARKTAAVPQSPEGGTIETATPQLRVPEGVRLEGFLTLVDCSDGLTIRLRVGNTAVELHTDTPSKVEFMSYVSTITDTFACGPIKPEVPVAVVYRRNTDRRFLGEPLRVDFVKPD
jgi:hypothetical protein